MHIAKKYCHHILFILMTAALISGCAAGERPFIWPNEEAIKTAPITKTPQIRLIIKFKDHLTPSQVRNKLIQLGLQHQVHLSLVREMSGEAFVIQLKTLEQQLNLASLLNRIQQQPDVAYIEEDRVMHHQNNHNK